MASYGTNGLVAGGVTYSWHSLVGGAQFIKLNVGNGQSSVDVAITAGVRFTRRQPPRSF